MVHLLKFVPQSLERLMQDFSKLKEYCESLTCTVLVVDICTLSILMLQEHKFSGLIKYQRRVNEILKDILKGSTNVTVMDHTKFLGLRWRWLWSIKNYRPIMGDSVHFHDKYYDIFVRRFMYEILKKGTVMVIPT